LDARPDFAMPTGIDHRRRSPGRSLAIALVVWMGGVASGLGADDPTTRRPGEFWPSAVILEPPANRDALLQKLRRPDLLIWDGDGFERWLLGRAGPTGGSKSGQGVVGSVSVRIAASGADDRGRVVVEYRISVDGDDRVKAPIGLDGLILGKVAEAGRDLAVSNVGDGRAWAVELSGRGEHLVEVETTAPIRSAPSGKTCELAIPPAASTRVELVAVRPLVSARAGFDEPLVLEPPPGGTRAEGRLSPRARLELAWQEQELPGEALPPLLTARGELVVTPSLGSIETRETWSVAAIRGSTRQVVIQLDPSDEVVDLEVDRRPVAIDRREGVELVIPLFESIGPASSPETATILLTTKRSLPPGKSARSSRFAIRGHPIRDARSQTGVLAVARSDAWLTSVVEGRGVRRVDPKTDLPDAFRGRPEGWLGFVFADRSFDLLLEVEAAAPRFEVNARSTVMLRGDQAEVVTTMLGRVWGGRLFEAQILVPPGLVYEPTDPETEGATIRPASNSKWSPRPVGPASPSNAGSEALLATFPRPLGPGERFAVTLRGACRGVGDEVSALGLFQMLGPSVASTEVALVTGRDRRVDLIEGGPNRFARLDPASPPSPWVWPRGFDPRSGSAPTWLRAERSEGSVSIRVAAFPKVVRHRSNLTVAIDRQGADVVDEVSGDVANGTTGALEIALPPEVNERWVAESGEGLEREPLDSDPSTGWRRYRLKLPEAVDAFQVRLRYRLEFALKGPDPTADPLRLRVRPIRVLDGASTGQAVRLMSESDVAVDAEAPGWTSLAGGLRGAPESTQQVRRSFEHLGEAARAIEVSATLGRLADLPTLVASRLWLHSTQLPGGGLATTAQFRLEAHGRSFLVRLPEGSRWVRGVAGTVEVASSDVERIDRTTYQITLPAGVGQGPLPVRVDSILDEPPGDDSWPAPELVDGVVQQSVWELSLLGSRAGVGVPDGWTDENVWHREGLIWKRRPRAVEADLTRWLTADGQARPAPAAANARPGQAADPSVVPVEADGDWLGDFGGGRYSYLFSRPGPPTPLRFATHTRTGLLLVCSGPVLVVGLLILARRPPPRWVAGGLLAAGFGFVATVEPNTVILVAESSSVGFALAGTAALIHGSLERRGRPAITPPPEAVPAPTPRPSALSSSSYRERPKVSESNRRTVVRKPPDRVDGSTSEFPHPPEGPSSGSEPPR